MTDLHSDLIRDVSLRHHPDTLRIRRLRIRTVFYFDRDFIYTYCVHVCKRIIDVLDEPMFKYRKPWRLICRLPRHCGRDAPTVKTNSKAATKIANCYTAQHEIVSERILDYYGSQRLGSKGIHPLVQASQKTLKHVDRIDTNLCNRIATFHNKQSGYIERGQLPAIVCEVIAGKFEKADRIILKGIHT